MKVDFNNIFFYLIMLNFCQRKIQKNSPKTKLVVLFYELLWKKFQENMEGNIYLVILEKKKGILGKQNKIMKIFHKIHEDQKCCFMNCRGEKFRKMFKEVFILELLRK